MNVTPEFQSAFERLEVAVHAIKMAVPTIGDYFDREAMTLLSDEVNFACIIAAGILDPDRGEPCDNRWKPGKLAGGADAR